MARITVEDCLDHVENRFELVMVGTKRARQLATKGREPMVPWENDKPTVVALREIEFDALPFGDEDGLEFEQAFIDRAEFLDVERGVIDADGLADRAHLAKKVICHCFAKHGK